MGVRLLLDVVGGLKASADNPLDCHDKTESVALIILFTLKYLIIGLNIK